MSKPERDLNDDGHKDVSKPARDLYDDGHKDVSKAELGKPSKTSKESPRKDTVSSCWVIMFIHLKCNEFPVGKLTYIVSSLGF